MLGTFFTLKVPGLKTIHALNFLKWIKKGGKRSLEPKDELFLTLVRLRVNIPENVMADNSR